METTWGKFFRRVRFAALFCLINLGACSKVGNFFAEKCAANNPNCFDPGLEMISAGGKSDLGGDEIGSGTSTDDLAPHDVVFNERTNITLTLTNPKLYPLRDFTVVFSNPDSGYEILPSDDSDACLNVESLDYQESCTVTISYIYDGTTTPSETDVTFVFKTPKGQELTFSIPLSKPVILADFSVSNTDTKYTIEDDVISAPRHLIYNGATGNYQGTLHVKNWSEDDITNMAVDLAGDVEFWIDASSTCVNAMTLASGDDCDVVLNYLPTSTGAFTGTLSFTSGTGAPEDAAHTYTISGSADQITASDSSFDFGTTFATYPGGTATITVTNPNPGMATDNTCALSFATGTAYTVSANTCSSTLAADSNCSFTVDFIPQATPGTYDDTATLSCELGGEISVEFTSQVFEVPVITWTPEVGETTDFGNVDLGGYHEITYTLTNTSATLALTSLVVSLDSPSSAEWSLESTTCTSALAALGTCEAVLRFTTANAGAETATLRATSTSEVTTVDANLTANGTAMELVLTPDAADDTLNSYTYADREIDEVGSESHTFTLKNNGNRDAIIAGTFDVGSSSLFTDTGGGTCAGLAANTLAASASCTYIISFTADSAASVATATFTATDTGGAAPVTDSVSLTGETVPPPPVLTWTPEVGEGTDFGDVDVSGYYEITYTLTNTSPYVALTNLSVTLATPSSAEWTINSTTCTASLAALGTCDAVVRFTPTNAGAETVTLSATSTNEAAVEATEDLTANGTSMVLVLTPDAADNSLSTYEYADRVVSAPGSGTHTFTLKNNGNRTATIAGGFEAGSSNLFADTGTGTCGATLAATATCTYVLSFTADSIAGVDTATFTVNESGASTPASDSVAITGETVAAPSLQIKDNLDNTSYVASIGQSDITDSDTGRSIIDLSPASQSITFSIKNNGGSALSSLDVCIGGDCSSPMGALKLENDSCSGADLDAAEVCTFDVTFTPTDYNDVSTNLEVSGTGALDASPYSVVVTILKADSTKSTHISIDTASLTLGPIDVSTTASSADITVTNDSDHGATGLSLTFDNAALSTTTAGIADPTQACGSSLASGATCLLKVVYTPANNSSMPEASARSATLNYTKSDSSTVAESSAIAIQVSSFNDKNITSNADEGILGDVQVDSTYGYFVSKHYNSGASAYTPVLHRCSRDASSGAILNTSCTRYTPLGATANISGDQGQTWVRLALSTQYVILTLHNKDTTGGSATPGSSNGVLNAVVCAKSNLSTCTRYDMGYTNTDTSGRSPTALLVGTKYLVAHYGTSVAGGLSNALTITICDFSDATGVLSTCKNNEVGVANQGYYPGVDYDGTYVVVASRYSSSPVLTVCGAPNASNTISCNAATSSIDASSGGYFPSVVIASNKIYVTHGSSGNTSATLRVTRCDLNTGAGTVDPSTCVSSQVGNQSQIGSTSTLIKTSSNLWIGAVQQSGASSYANDNAKLVIYKCSISGSWSISVCSSETPIYTQKDSNSFGYMANRSLAYDSSKQMFFMQYPRNTAAGNANATVGFINFGATAELP